MYHHFQNLIFRSNKLNILLGIFILAGIALRIFHFIYNRSLWMDEVYLSTSLIKYNYYELIHSPLYYEQKAPIGFLLFVKLIVNVFGENEYALRLFPLLSGVLSIFIFVPVCRHFVNKQATVLALGILCLSPALVYHSVEIKQYATELLATLLCLYLFIRFKDKKSFGAMLLWGLIGGIILWFSYSAIFILAGIAVNCCIHYTVTKQWNCLFRITIAFSIWFFFFLLNYLLFTHKHAESTWITYWFRSYGNFMPLIPKSSNDLKWFPLTFYRMMDYPLGLLWSFFDFNASKFTNTMLKLPIIPISLFIIGSLYFINKEKRKAALLFIPILLTLLASGLEFYPLTERFWVFISPIFIILIARGFESIFLKNTRKRITKLLYLLIILPGLIQSTLFIIYPEKFYVHKKSFQREALTYVNEHYGEGDGVYIYWNNLPGYRLYKLMYPLRFKAVEGKDVRKMSTDYETYYRNLASDFQKLKDKNRIWVVVNHKYLTDIGDLIDEPSWYYEKSPPGQLLMQFNNMGKIIRKYKSSDISVYLVEVNRK